MYEQSTPGRRFGPALIALLVVLAAMAGTMAYLVVHQIVLNQSANPATAGTVGSQNPIVTSSTTASPGLTGTAKPSDKPSATSTASPTDPGTSCPAITERAVVDQGLAGGLTLLMYVHVAGAKSGESEAEAWVCQNKDGVLIYQGHVLSGLFSAATSSYTLLLAQGIKGAVFVEGDGYVAENPGLARKAMTEYHVHRDELSIVHLPGGGTVHYPVISAYPPA